MQVVGEKSLEFEGFTLDLTRGCLRRAEGEIKLRPKGFRLLHYLARNAGRLVSKGDIIDAVWPDVVVTDESLARCVSDVRLALHDADQHIIKTVPRRGYLFAARVSPAGAGAASAAAPSGQADERAFSREKPRALAREVEVAAPRLSVVVLPFVNLGSDRHQDFVDAITESLTTDLSRIPGAFVIARNTAFAYKGKAVDVRQIGRELGVRYIMEGSVQSSAERVRVNAQLVDTQTGAHLWAERFDKPRADLFEMQDEIIARLARIGGIELIAAESRRVDRHQAYDMDSVDLAMRGWAIMNQPRSLSRSLEARALFEAALRLDERNADALVGLGETHLYEALNFLSENLAESSAAADAAAAKALAVAPNSAGAHFVRCRALSLIRAPELALRECELVTVLDRNFPYAHAWAGVLKIYLGRAEETEAHVSEAIRLSPRDPALHSWYFYLGAAYLYLGRLEQASDLLRKSVELNPEYDLAYFNLAAALALSGHATEAAAARAAGRHFAPHFTVGKFRSQPRGDNPIYLAQRERVADGMRKAGVPE